MNGQIKAIAAKTTIWLVVEVILTITGLDNMADYSEFIFGKEFAFGSSISSTLVVSSQFV